MIRFELCLHLRFSSRFCSVVKAHIDTPGRKLCNQTVSPGFTGRPNRGCGAGTFGLMMGGKLVLVVFGWLFGWLLPIVGGLRENTCRMVYVIAHCFGISGLGDGPRFLILFWPSFRIFKNL